jgi:hypothetical protein
MAFDAMYDKQKESHGGTATFVWIGTSLALLLSHSYPGLLSWQGLTFIIVGMFVAAVIMGGVGYWIQRQLARWLMARHGDNFSTEIEKTIFKYGIGLLVFEAAINVLFCVWVFNSFFGRIR